MPTWKKRIFICFLISLFRMFVFNFKHWESYFLPTLDGYHISVGEGLEQTNEHEYRVKDLNSAYFEITDIIRLHLIGDSMKLRLWIAGGEQETTGLFEYFLQPLHVKATFLFLEVISFSTEYQGYLSAEPLFWGFLWSHLITVFSLLGTAEFVRAMLSIVFRKFIPKLNRLDCYVPG